MRLTPSMSLIACEKSQVIADQGSVDSSHGLCRQLLPHIFTLQRY